MKNIKDITISIFAIIGFAFLLSSFTQSHSSQVGSIQKQEVGIPESHVWEMTLNSNDAYMFNKVTGEVRILSGEDPRKGGTYTTMQQQQP